MAQAERVVPADDEQDPDLEPLRAAAAGDAAACRRLVDRHLRPLHAFAARVLDDASEAEDVCQESFMKLWQFAPQWTPGRAKVSTWLYQVALNACRDRQRRRRPEAAADPDELHSTAPGPGRLHDRAETGDRVRRAMAELPARQREALVLFHFEGHTQSEAAAVLEVSVDALESLLARARRTLRDLLADAAPTDDEEGEQP
jgi:RNA polymerase sigma-70 factor, ECF subfamily